MVKFKVERKSKDEDTVDSENNKKTDKKRHLHRSLHKSQPFN